MNFSTLKSILIVLAVAGSTLAQDKQYQKQDTARLTDTAARKAANIDFSGLTWENEKVNPESASLVAARERAMLMLKNSKTQMQARTVSDTAAVANLDKNQVAANKQGENNFQAKGPDGQQANALANDGKARVSADGQNAQGILQTDSSDNVKGGMASVQGHNGVMKTNEAGSNRMANLAADNVYKADTAQIGDQDFRAKTYGQGVSEGRYNVHTDSQSKADGTGSINVDNDQTKETFHYTNQIVKNGAETKSKAEFSADNNGVGTLLNRRIDKWTCDSLMHGDEDATANCYNQEGTTVGKVQVNGKGEATVTDKSGVVVGRARVIKSNDQGGYRVVIIDDLMEAGTKEIHKQDCYAEVVPGGKQTKKVKVENLKVNVNGETNADGSTSYSWPTCFDVEADVTIPDGVDTDRIAFEYLGHIMPMGKIRCEDSLTCGRECYYCNACDKNKLLEEPLFYSGNFCSMKGTAVVQKLKMKVCPPEDFEKAVMCGGFDRHIIGNGYYNYNDSLSLQIRVWQQPENEETLRKQFFTKVSQPFGLIGLQTEFGLDHVNEGRVDRPHNNELLQWYVRKNGDEELLACQKVTVDYQLTGSSMNDNVWLDAIVNLKNVDQTKLFQNSACDEWKAAQDKEYAAYKKEASASGSSGGTNVISEALSRFRSGRLGRK